MLNGVIVSESKTQKDELILEGNDVDNVSQSGEWQRSWVLAFVMNILPQPHPFKAYVASATKISVNSLMVSTCQTKAQSTRTEALIFFSYVVWCITSYVLCHGNKTICCGATSHEQSPHNFEQFFSP